MTAQPESIDPFALPADREAKAIVLFQPGAPHTH